MQTRKLFLLFLAGVVASSATVVSAQQRPARYTPARPTISPYLNLLRRDTGPVPNYFTLVRPEFQQRAINQQQQAINELQRQDLLNQEQSLQQLQDSALRLRDPSMRSTGTGGGFMNFSHYYTSPRPTIGRR
jgi:hypothetical protein